MRSLLKLLLVMSLSMTLIACQSQGNRARKDLAKICTGSFESTDFTLQFPPEAKVQEKGKREVGKFIFIPASRYNALLRHAKELAECGKGSQCLIQLTEHERDCEASWAEKLESSLVPGLFHFRGSCKIPKPDCEIGV